MSTIDNNGTTHETHTYSFEVADDPTGVTTWWAWECTCGKGDSGVDEVFASDLAFTHEQRVTACTCASPTVTVRTRRFVGGDFKATAACNCGFNKAASSHYLYGSASQARRTAQVMLEKHTCRALCGHTHNHPAPEIVTAQR